MTAALTLPVVYGISDLGERLGDRAAPRILSVVMTSVLAATVGWRALAARSHLRARLWLAAGAGLAGAVATWLAYVAATMARNVGFDLPIGAQILGSLAMGGGLGFLFGTAFGPVIVTARRAIASPSLDGADRVVFAAGASLLVAAVTRVALKLDADLLGPVLVVVSLAAMMVAASRIVERVELVERARRGVEPGFHLLPATAAEDESELVPIVRTARPPEGVLAATGVSVPYRGARGVLKLGRAPLPEEPFDRPVAQMVHGALTEGATSVATLAVGSIVVAALIVPLAMVLTFAVAAIDEATSRGGSAGRTGVQMR
jgi:hypothetical protein